MEHAEAVKIYLQSLKALCPALTEAELNYMKSGISVARYKPRQFFLHAGAVQQEIGFVFSGLLRAFYLDQYGNEISVNFVGEGNYATHYSSFLTQTASKYAFQCLEPSVLVLISYAHIQQGYEAFPKLERYGRLIAEEILRRQQKRIEGFLFDTAEARYLEFVQAYPELFNRVSLSHLSSFLGIERQTLTRIRKKLAKSRL
jgi:CRP/FNR family transcriptional regulator